MLTALLSGLVTPSGAEGQRLGPEPGEAGLPVDLAQPAPPLSPAVIEALGLAVQQCWTLGASPSGTRQTTVVVSVDMRRDGTPDNGSIRLVSSETPGGEAERIAFEAARRAIIRCGARGFPLPEEKYPHWKRIEMTFDPEGAHRQ
ncbi:hypothetical protein P1J78_03765 [Psychromarinibacter sp. C21-152]|uniref:Energy transducer TonB n=1 Tax=Psychromarinibacter sediminicola TaxID=3033385 RepID=A0AAE3T7L7_9RHOB|nr:hypothetical protein [Psychromarinibacter sediminicola]MDF0599843.1 hypothetical protein [Psychromarinibacter sediminicola]